MKKHIYMAHHQGTSRLIEALHKAGVRSHIATAWEITLPSQHQFLELLSRGVRVETAGSAQTGMELVIEDD